MPAPTLRGFAPIRAARGPLLGQALPAFRVVVTDPRGVPFSNAVVTIGDHSVKADSEGNAVFSLQDQDVTARYTVLASVKAGNYTITKEGLADQTLFIQIPACAPTPLLTTPELLSFAGGSVLVAAGLYWKLGPLQVAGEVLFGAAIFTAVYRHSCSA